MRALTVICWLLLAPVLAANASPAVDTDALWDRANTAYVNGDYSRAIVTYDSIADAGFVSKKLYYNLGNAWYKNGGIGKAVLYYNRALRLDPSDPDARHNLKVVNALVKDKIDAVPEFFLTGWFRAWGRTMGPDGWAAISLVMFAVTLASVLVYLLTKSMRLRKVGFYTALLCLFIGLAAVSFSVRQKNEISRSGEAVVMRESVAVRSSPDNASKELFVLHEGTKVKLGNSLGGWHEIVIADGNKGWLPESAIEVI